VLLGGLLGLALASVAQAGDKVTITFANWAGAEDATRAGIEQRIAAFEAMHPDIQITSEAISFSEIAHQLVLRVNSGNPPDVAQMSGNDTFLLATTGALEPLDPYLGPLRSAFIPALLDELRYKDKLIALPWTVGPSGFWYNKKIMKQAGLDPEHPPRTMPELMAALKAIKASQPGVIPLGLDTTNRPFSLTSNWPWMLAFGAEPVGSTGHGADSPEMRSYLAWMRELAQNGYIEPGRKIGEFRPLAAQDKVAFTWDELVLQGVVQSTNHMTDQQFYDSWGLTSQPVGASGKPYAYDGGNQLVMFASGAHKQAAWEFMTYLATSPEAIKDYTIKYESSLPPLAHLDPSVSTLLDTPVYKAALGTLVPTVAPQPYGLAFAKDSTAIMAGVQQAVTGSQSIDAIAASIQAQLNR
jgi:multiple sugar transport system substrate-binding protein